MIYLARVTILVTNTETNRCCVIIAATCHRDYLREFFQVHKKSEEGDFVFGAREWLITSLRTSKGDCPSTRKQRAHGSLHLSLDHLSLAGHVLVVSPYTSSRTVCIAAPVRVRVVCSPRTRAVRDAETTDRDVGRESARRRYRGQAFARNLKSRSIVISGTP